MLCETKRGELMRSYDDDAERIETLSVLQCVFARPGMYTPFASIQELVSFLSGYHAANHDDHEVGALLVWLHESLDLVFNPRFLNPTGLIEAIGQHYEDDTEFIAAVRDHLQREGLAEESIKECSRISSSKGRAAQQDDED